MPTISNTLITSGPVVEMPAAIEDILNMAESIFKQHPQYDEMRDESIREAIAFFITDSISGNEHYYNQLSTEQQSELVISAYKQFTSQ